MKISVVIPTYNERKNISKLVTAILNVASKNKLNVTIIIVDDNSPDGTAAIVKTIKNKQNIILIENNVRLGLGRSYILGFKKALELNSDLVFSMDADFSHNPKYIPDFIKKVNSGYDVVLGSRYVEGGGNNWGITRRIISKGGNTLARFILGININDLTTGYRCYTAKALKAISLDSITSTGYSFLEEILFMCSRKNLKIVEIPIYFKDRTLGESKLKKREIIKFFFTIIRLKLGSIFGKN